MTRIVVNRGMFAEAMGEAGKALKNGFCDSARYWHSRAKSRVGFGAGSVGKHREALARLQKRIDRCYVRWMS
jgi:hypothetical protein